MLRIKSFLPRRTQVVFILVLLFVAFALRGWTLDSIPPGLDYDEAGQGLDARDVLHGHVRVFFPRSMGKEPLYIYLTVPVVALGDRSPWAVRAVAALLGTWTVLGLYTVARSLFPSSLSTGTFVGLVAAGLWVVNYWPQSINRLGFRVNTLPFVLLWALVSWERWVRNPSPRRALLWGIWAGLTLLTYLSARATLLLWPVLYVTTLSPEERRRLRPSMPLALLAASLVAGPMFIHLAFHPEDAVSRVSSFPLWQIFRRPSAVFPMLLQSAWDIIGGFAGWAGDRIPRHNIPGRPPMFPLLGPLFVGGFLLALYYAFRGKGEDRRNARVLLSWWVVMCLPALLAAADNPHFLRLFGALPAAFLLIGWLIYHLYQRLPHSRRWVGTVAVFLLLLVEGGRTTYAYFVTWAQHTDLYEWFQLDMWTIGHLVRDTPNSVGLIPLNITYDERLPNYTLEYAFPDVPLLRFRVFEDRIESWLTEHLGPRGGTTVLLVQWLGGYHVNADPKGILSMYLGREGVFVERKHFRTFDVLTYRLGPHPNFSAPGREVRLHVPFHQGVTLVNARWGGGYPLQTRTHNVSAGAPLWAILTWRVEHPMPDIKVTLDLVDSRGHRLASDERLLLDAQRFPPSQWTQGQVVRSYHLLHIPASQPAGEVHLESRVYFAQSFIPIPAVHPSPRGSAVWDTVHVQWPPSPPAEKEEVPEPLGSPIAVGDFHLVGHDPIPSALMCGETVVFRLFWDVERPDAITKVGVYLEGVESSSQVIVRGKWPNTRVYTFVDLRVPPTTRAGDYRILLRPLKKSSIPLAQVHVNCRERTFVPPAVDVPVTGTFGEAVTLLGVRDVRVDSKTLAFTLIWRVQSPSDRPLIRFVHVLDGSGRLRGQVDSVPCQGGCPAFSWVAGEILLDRVTIALPSAPDVGKMQWVVGWYDAATLQRLPAYDIREMRLPEDVLPLPLVLSD